MPSENQQLADGSIDPNVRIPDHVKAAAANVDKLHEQFYPKDPNQQAAPLKEAIPQPDQAAPDPALAAAAAAQAEADRVAAEKAAAQAQTQNTAAVAQPADNDVSADAWKHRFLSMQGRFNAQVKANGAMEEQMRQLARELMTTQSLLAAAQQAPPLEQNSRRDHGKLITEEDRNTYGDDFLDVAQRAARAAIAPELEDLRAQNQSLQKTVNSSVKRDLFASVAQTIPNWRQINATTQWKAWLALRNIYTGEVRQQILNKALSGADAPKIVALFKDFLAEANATGSYNPAPQERQQQDPNLVPPRQAAVSLDTLAAPGRARPAPGDTGMPANKPTYTRAQISKFYDDSRKGLYAGREDLYRATEADLTAAQAEGRIRG